MHNKINEEVARLLIGRRIVGIVSKESILILELDNDAELRIRETMVRGADGGMYNSTEYIYYQPSVLFLT
ncbi:MAG: hypothetical protein HZB99_02700 [Candidatus Harrisonbacteria bacterium]|nr:hypothetical protein [Candidatus Harrisonbacteria bacterium]